MRTRRPILTGVTLLVVAVASRAIHAGDFASEMKSAAKSVAEGSKKAGKEIARESKEVGHAIADTSKEVGRETARGAKTAWFKTRDFATEKSKRVADATVRYWNEVIRSKEDERDRLADENERLKK
jgi:hypothetical protein